MSNSNKLFPELELLNRYVFQACGIELKKVETELESQEYGAHHFELHTKKVKFRMAKITPTKTGQFVTIWKRNKNGKTEPYNILDEYEFYIIATREETKFGIFIFNKNILSEKGILTTEHKEGKRGIRVYPTWCFPTSKQAQKTQNWQTNYFVALSKDNQIDLKKTKILLNLK